MDASIARVIGSVCIALCGGMDKDRVDTVATTLHRWADNPANPDGDRYIYGVIAHSISRPVEELADESAPRSRLEVITGGDAA